MRKVVSFKEIDSFAENIANYILKQEKINGNFLIALNGDLGTGKTTFAKKIAFKLGVLENVKSPTFTLVQEYYQGHLPIFHFDVYRLAGNSEDIYEIGFEEYLYKNGVIIIEWADIIQSELPEEYLDIRFYHNDENTREIQIEYKGNRALKEEILKYVCFGD